MMRTSAVTALLILSMSAAANGQGRTDVVTLRNGDRITGEVVALDRGRLEFKTDDAGTLYLEWDKLLSVVASRQVEVATADGQRFVGTLQLSTAQSIAIAGPGDTVTLSMADVTQINAVGRSFWGRIKFSI